jgi:hypothetical protein
MGDRATPQVRMIEMGGLWSPQAPLVTGGPGFRIPLGGGSERSLGTWFRRLTK